MATGDTAMRPGPGADAAGSARPSTIKTLTDRLQLDRMGRQTLLAATQELSALRTSHTWAADLRAAVVTSLVAFPLCIGIAITSGAPPLTGIVTGIIGGILVGLISQSPFMVTGPAAGLTAITISGVAALGSYRGFLAALVVAGAMQVALSVAGAGVLSYVVPLSVIKGMLAAVGVILILKQIPHAVGYSVDFVGDESFRQLNNENTFSGVISALERVHPGAATLTALSLILLIAWSRTTHARRWVPGPLLIVVIGVALNAVFAAWRPTWALAGAQLVSLPVLTSWSDVGRVLQGPEWSVLAHAEAWRVGLTIGLVASLESLLSLSATSRIDPYRREPSTNRELLAQGIGNTVSGLIGGLPMSGVVVRSAVNVDAGAKTKAAVMMHALLLLLAVALIPFVLNAIPLAALAAILLYTGYRLAHPSLLQHVWRQGWRQFTPFLVTAVAILVTDLLTGLIAGLAVGFLFVLLEHQRSVGYTVVSPHGAVLTRLRFNDTVSFLHKASLAEKLEGLPPGSRIELDGRHAKHLDHDVLELIHEFKETAKSRNIDYRLVGIPESTIMPSHQP